MRPLRARAPVLVLLGLALASAGCVGFAFGNSNGAKETETDMSLYGGYFDGGPARDYRFRGAASRASAGTDRPPDEETAAPGK